MDVPVDFEVDTAGKLVKAQADHKTTRRELRASEDLVALLRKGEDEYKNLKKDFVGMASHEFKTPISAISLSTSLIETYITTGDSAKINVHLEKIRKGIATLNDSLNNFLLIEKLNFGDQVVSNSAFHLSEFAADLIGKVQRLTKSGQTINVKHAGTTDLVNLDKTLLRHIVFSLLSNALNYSPKGTPIDLQTEVYENLVILSVRDQGIGIPEAEQHQLFNAFYRATNTRGIPGTGLGLHLVARYTDMMNGELSLSSKVGEGTSVTLFFKQ